MDPQPSTYQPLVIRRGRRFGWWVEGRKKNGRLYMFTWWPTKAIASSVARMCAALLRRVARAEIAIEIQDTPDQAA
jgi:hypothetical protein